MQTRHCGGQTGPAGGSGGSLLERISGLNLALFGLFVRLLTLFIIQYFERINNVPLTDVDYFVFTDAAGMVSRGLSPYLRHTYRYTPYLAWILQPAVAYPLFGKIIFILVDWAAACIILAKFGKVPATIYLFNPLTIGIAARGNAEALIVFICLLSLVTVNHWYVSGPLLALAVHLKTYPAPWALTIWLYHAAKVGNFKKWRIPWSLEGTLLGLSSLLTFSALTLSAYSLYGDEFAEHAHLHHLTRQDTRHNFSIWFLSFYLHDGRSIYAGCCFISQVVLFIVISFKYAQDVYFASFLHAFVFVSFNKVITSQYFIWYISLLPCVLPRLQSISPACALFYIVIWFAGQAVWLLPAYYLEHVGLNTFLPLHLGAVLHFITNICCISTLIRHYQSPKLKRS